MPTETEKDAVRDAYRRDDTIPPEEALTQMEHIDLAFERVDGCGCDIPRAIHIRVVAGSVGISKDTENLVEELQSISMGSMTTVARRSITNLWRQIANLPDLA